MYDVSKTMRRGLSSSIAMTGFDGCLVCSHRGQLSLAIAFFCEQQGFVLLEQHDTFAVALALTNEGGVMPRALAQFSFSAIDMQPQLVQH
jgi:hypothetical protein